MQLITTSKGLGADFPAVRRADAPQFFNLPQLLFICMGQGQIVHAVHCSRFSTAVYI